MVHILSRGGACSSGQPTSMICKREKRAASVSTAWTVQRQSDSDIIPLGVTEDAMLASSESY